MNKLKDSLELLIIIEGFCQNLRCDIENIDDFLKNENKYFIEVIEDNYDYLLLLHDVLSKIKGQLTLELISNERGHI